MDVLPGEINALIVTDLSNSKVSLSSLSLACTNALPFIRALRFAHVVLNTQSKLLRLLSLIDGAPEISNVIRDLEIYYCNLTEPHELSQLVSSASNLQELTLHGRTCMNDIIDLPAASLEHTQRLRKIYLIALSFPRLSDLTQLLDFVPYGTALSLEGVSIQELSTLARRLRPGIADVQWDSTMHCPPWDTQDFEAPKPVPQITGLKLRLSGPHYLLFLDILSSPKSPIPNLQDISLRFYPVKRYVPHRLAALLERYRTSLRVLEVDGLDKGEFFVPVSNVYTDLRSAVPALILPPTLERFKWPVTLTDMKAIERFRQILESSHPTLKIVSLNHTKSVDKIIAEIDWKFAWNESGLGTKFYPRSLKQSMEGEWRGGTSWV